MPLYGSTPDATSTRKGKLLLTNDLGGTADLPTVPALKAAQVSSLSMFGHSWQAGQSVGTTGVDYFEQSGMTARLAGLCGAHVDNIEQFGTSGSWLTQTGAFVTNSISGWGAILQFMVPNNSTHISSNGVQAQVSVNQAGANFFVHGVNDLQFNKNVLVSNGGQGLNAWKHGVRTYISRRRAGALYCSKSPAGTMTWDSVFAFSASWATNVNTILATGAGYRHTSTNAETMTMTLPADWPGGTLAVCFQGSSNGYTTVASMTSGATSMTVAANSTFPQSGTFVADIAAEGANTREEVLITAGAGTNTWTITRAQNGTSASAHANAVVTVATDTFKVNWSTSAVSGTGLFTTATGSTALSGQGYGSTQRMAVIKRFSTIAADAGKTIVATAAGIVTGDTSAQVIFDSAWLESDNPAPTIIVNIPRLYFSVVASGSANFSDIASMNTATAAVVAEFDSYVKIADVDADLYNRSGVANGATGTGTTIAFTANDVTTFNLLMNASPFRSFKMKVGGEDLLVTAIAYVSGSNYNLTVVRGYNSTTNSSKADQSPISYMVQFWTDNLHCNAKGHAYFAKKMYDALCSITNLPTYTLAEAAGNWTQDSALNYLQPPDNGYITPNNTAATANLAITLQVVGYVPVFIPRDLTISEIGCIVGTLSANSVIELGIYDSDWTSGRPGNLIASCGTVSGASAGIKNITGLALRVRKGMVWLAAVQTVAAASVRCISSDGLLYPVLFTSTMTTTPRMVVGYNQTGQATLPSGAGTLTEVSSTAAVGNFAPYVFLRIRKTQLA